MLLKPRFFYLLFCLTLSRSVMALEPLEVKIAYVGQATEMASLGAESGIKEANIQGEFLGQKYSLKHVAIDHEGVISGVSAILSSADAEQLESLSQQNPGIPVFNLADESDQLREQCNAAFFHIIPSQKMRADAVSQWQKKHSESKAHAEAWHSSFKKYAASQVNKRFQDMHKKAMDDHAYAGWMAVKVISDAVARTNSNQADKISHFLKTDLAVDGAKGLQMNFRATGQLRQMMLLVEGDKVVGEAPVRGVVETTDLDSLGIIECTPCDNQ